MYNDSKEVFAVFGEQFSEDADSWHGEQTDDDIWQRTRTALGDWGTPTYIGAPSAVEWEVLRTFVNIYSTGGDYNTILLSTDLTEAEELRFRMYGLASGVTRRAPIIEQNPDPPRRWLARRFRVERQLRQRHVLPVALRSARAELRHRADG